MNTMLMKRLGHGRETAYGDLVISREQGLGVWNLNLFFSLRDTGWSGRVWKVCSNLGKHIPGNTVDMF